RVHLLCRAGDFATHLGLVRAGLALGELPVNATLDEVGARLEPENGVRQIDGSGLFAFERGDLHFHVTRPPSSWGRPAFSPWPAWHPLAARALQPEPARLRLLLRQRLAAPHPALPRRPRGICPASALPSAALSSRRRAR